MGKIVGRNKILILSLVLLAACLLLYQFYPKLIIRFYVFAVLFLIDVYLWRVYIKKRNLTNRLLNCFLLFVYSLPFILFLLFGQIGLFNGVKILYPTLFVNIERAILIIYVAKLFPFFAAIFSDLLRGLKYLKKHYTARKKNNELADGEKISRSRFIKNIGLFTGGVVLGTMVFGQFKWTSNFKIHSHIIPIKKLPESFKGFKIVQISDLHLGSWASVNPMIEMVQMINDLDADVVVFTGDLVNMKTNEAFRFENILSEIEAKHGVFAVLGNHDYGGYAQWKSPADKKRNLLDLFKLYKRMGWKLLLNENVTIENDKQEIALIGVENWGQSRRFPRIGNVKTATEGLGDSVVKILLSHDPSHFEKIISKQHPEIDLTLSGHTHGFQFGIETNNFRWSPAQYLYEYWAGLYKVKHQYLYVNRGTGFSGLPGRIGIFPEITEIILI